VEIALKIQSKWQLADFPDVPINIISKKVKRSDVSYKRLLFRQQRETEGDDLDVDNEIQYQVVLGP